MPGITDREIAKCLREAQQTGEKVPITASEKARGVGRLLLIAQPNGECPAYFRYTDSTGNRDTYPTGLRYDPKGAAGHTLKQIRARAGELSRLYQSGVRDLRAHLEHQQAEERARIEAAARAREEKERQAKSGTTRALLSGYIAHLEQQGKSSAGNVRSLVTNHVLEAFPHLADAPAHELTREHASTMLSKLVEKGHGRTAGKLRSYGRSAWACAMDAAGDPTIHPALHGFHLHTNPWAMVPSKSVAKYNRALDRVLSESEMREFLRALDGEPDGPIKDAIWLALLLGGQRMSQLVRVRPQDVDADEHTVMLYDGKGARKQPRPHCLPLTRRASEVVARRLALRDQNGNHVPYLLTSYGKAAVRMETVSNAVTAISSALMKEQRITTPFSLRDLRRTCETMLARMGISKDIRAQILSHGLGGVQDRHYDRHSYMDEKRRALEAWDARLEEMASGRKQSNVLPLPAGSTRTRGRRSR